MKTVSYKEVPGGKVIEPVLIMSEGFCLDEISISDWDEMRYALRRFGAPCLAFWVFNRLCDSLYVPVKANPEGAVAWTIFGKSYLPNTEGDSAVILNVYEVVYNAILEMLSVNKEVSFTDQDWTVSNIYDHEKRN